MIIVINTTGYGHKTISSLEAYSFGWVEWLSQIYCEVKFTKLTQPNEKNRYNTHQVRDD